MQEFKNTHFKLYFHYCEVYKQTYWLIHSVKDRQKVQEFINKRFKVEMGPIRQGNCLEVTTPDGFRVIVIIIMDHKNKYITMGTLAHEALHAISYNFESRGLKLSSDSEEAWAYYLDHLISKFSSVLKL